MSVLKEVLTEKLELNEAQGIMCPWAYFDIKRRES